MGAAPAKEADTMEAEEIDTSSGSHFIEIHARSAGASFATILGLFLTGAAMFMCLNCIRSRRSKQKAKARHHYSRGGRKYEDIEMQPHPQHQLQQQHQPQQQHQSNPLFQMQPQMSRAQFALMLNDYCSPA